MRAASLLRSSIARGAADPPSTKKAAGSTRDPAAVDVAVSLVKTYATKLSVD